MNSSGTGIFLFHIFYPFFRLLFTIQLHTYIIHTAQSSNRIVNTHVLISISVGLRPPTANTTTATITTGSTAAAWVILHRVLHVLLDDHLRAVAAAHAAPGMAVPPSPATRNRNRRCDCRRDRACWTWNWARARGCSSSFF